MEITLTICITVIIIAFISKIKSKPEIKVIETAELDSNSAIIFRLPKSDTPYTKEKLHMLQSSIKETLSKNGIGNAVFVMDNGCTMQIIKHPPPPLPSDRNSGSEMKSI